MRAKEGVEDEFDNAFGAFDLLSWKIRIRPPNKQWLWHKCAFCIAVMRQRSLNSRKRYVCREPEDTCAKEQGRKKRVRPRRGSRSATRPSEAAMCSLCRRGVVAGHPRRL